MNGRRLVGNLPWDNIKAIIQADLDYDKAHASVATAAPADDKCCEITIPSALKK
jgi:hypothetical protein